MKNTITTLFITVLLTFSTQSFAKWTSEHNPMAGWVATNGDQELKFKTEKGAKKAARALNKNDKKLAKEEEGVWNDGSEYCANPLNEC